MKRFKIILSFVMATFIVCENSFAQFPVADYSKSDSVSIEWGETTKIGTYEPDDVSFSLCVSSGANTADYYNVSYSVDGAPEINIGVSVSPEEDIKEKIMINTDAGIHDIRVSVKKNKNTILEETKRVNVIKTYTPQFMDRLNGRGICVHYMRSPYKEDKKFVNDLMKASGITVARDGYEWEHIEKTKKNYNFSETSIYTADAKEKGISTYWNASYGCGKLYPPAEGLDANSGWDALVRYGFPQTQESIQAYADFTQEVIEYFKNNDYPLTALETWNEMNSLDMKAATMAQIFTDFIRPVKIKSILNGNDDVDIATFTPHNKNQTGFLNGCMEMNFYPLFDRYAGHEYVHNNGFETSNEYQKKIKKLDDFITNYGGWKKIDLSETGFTTVGISTTATLESAAEEIPKTYVMGEYEGIDNMIIYDLMNDGTNPDYTEDNFGAVTYDGELKPQYLTMTNFNNQTSGAILIGELETRLPAGTRAFLYYKDGEPIVMAWANNDDDMAVEWNLKGECVDVIDNYGNLVASGAESAVLGQNPVYIKGMSDKWIVNAVYHDVVILNKEWLEQFSLGIPDEKLDNIKNLFKKTEEMLSDYQVTEEEALDGFKEYMQAGYLILDLGKNGNMEEVEVSKRLYRLYRIAEKLNNLYITLYNGEMPSVILNTYSESYKKSRTYLDEVKIKQYSDAILRFAKYYNDDIDIVKKEKDNPSKAGIIKAWDLMTEELCGWFDAFYEYETITNICYTLQSPDSDRVSYVNSDVSTELNLNNYGKEDFVGTIVVYDMDGKKVAESNEVTVKANGGYANAEVTINTAKPADNSGITYYNFSYVDSDGNVLYTLMQAYEVSDRYDVSVLPCADKIEDLKSVKLKITNKTDSSQNAHIKLESDNNFEFETNELHESVEANGEKIVQLPIKRIDDVKYHLYSFKYTVTDDNGYVVAERDTMLDFTSIVKSSERIYPEKFDGNIEDWEDAYPIYINVPTDASKKEAWQNAESSARAFMKWDEEHLYILVDVYDELYLQTSVGSQMWQGDSIQLAIDPNNDGGEGYQPDDFELGFSVTPVGAEWCAWQSPNGLSGGTDDWYKIVRNDDMCFTRYLISLDKEIIGDTELSEGNVLGLNLCINDNDYLSREGYYEFTYGIAVTKRPESFADFIMISKENKELADGYAAELFPVTIDADMGNASSSYSDIKGHWAEQIINAMSFEGIVSGMGDGSFMPDSDMTRAEGFALLKEALMLEGGRAGFDDVTEEEWYYSSIAALEGLIPEAMIENNEIHPQREITRQEMAYLIAVIYSKNTDEIIPSKDVMNYPDGKDVDLWAVEMMQKALGKRLISGDGDGNLYPKATLTRAEATVMVYNLLRAMSR